MHFRQTQWQPTYTASVNQLVQTLAAPSCCWAIKATSPACQRASPASEATNLAEHSVDIHRPRWPLLISTADPDEEKPREPRLFRRREAGASTSVHGGHMATQPFNVDQTLFARTQVFGPAISVLTLDHNQILGDQALQTFMQCCR